MYTTIDLTQKTGFLVLELPTATIHVYMYPNNQSLLISRRDEKLVVDVSPVGVGYPREDPATVASEWFSYIASENSGTIVSGQLAKAVMIESPTTVDEVTIFPKLVLERIASESIIPTESVDSKLVLESIASESVVLTDNLARVASTDLLATVPEVSLPKIASESIPTLLPVTSAAESPSEVSTKRPACSYSDDNNSTAKKQTTERNSRMIEEEKVTKQEEITPRALLAELKTVIRQRRVVDPFDPVSFFLFYNFDIHCFDTAVQDFIAYKRVIRKERLFERTFL